MKREIRHTFLKCVGTMALAILLFSTAASAAVAEMTIYPWLLDIPYGSSVDFHFTVGIYSEPFEQEYDASGTFDIYVDGVFYKTIPATTDSSYISRADGSLTIGRNKFTIKDYDLHGTRHDVSAYYTCTANNAFTASDAVTLRVIPPVDIPEFPSVVLPVAAVLGIIVIIGRRKE